MTDRLRHTLILILALALGAACGQSPGADPTPTPVVRAGEVYTCSNGLDGCRVTYVIGPVTRIDDHVKVEFSVTLAGPDGGTTSWTNDATYHQYLKSEGQRGIVLASSGDTAFYELEDVGGIAARDVTLVAPVTYSGHWQFVVPEAPGSTLLLLYPDFIDRPVPVTLP